MRVLLTAISFLFVSCSFTFCQSHNQFQPSYGLSIDLDLIVRSDDLDQEGIGFSIAVGGVKYLGESGKYRLTPSIESGAFQWQENDVLHKYYALNLLAQIDVIKYTVYSLTMNGGLVLDYSKSELGESRLKESYRMFLGNRLNLKSRWALELFNCGLAFSKDFIALRCTYFRLEYQF